MALDHNFEKEYDPKGLDSYNYNYDTHSFLGWRMWVAKFIELLWFSAGADKQLLSKCPHSERVKYMGLGGVVLATALLAFTSGSYAFFTVFGPKVASIFDPKQLSLSVFNSIAYLTAVIQSIVAGFIWALVIFNLDRFIVTSTGHGDGTEKITKQEFKNGLPRIILAIVVAICVAKPLEIRIFKTELDTEILELQITKLSTLKKAADDRYSEEVKLYEGKNALLREDIKNKEQEIQNISSDYRKELAGDKSTTTTGSRGAGPVSAKIEILAKEKESQYGPIISEAKKKIAENEINLAKAKKVYDQDYKEAKLAAAKSDGLAQRIKLSHEKFPLESFFLTLMLIFIEITPVFIKMQFIIGPYDYLIENQKQIVMAKYGIQEKYQTITDENGNPHQELVPIYHVAESISDYEVGKLNVEKSLVKTAHKIFQEKVSNDIISKPEKFMPDLKVDNKEKKKTRK
jgi:hypothetical protein